MRHNPRDIEKIGVFKDLSLKIFELVILQIELGLLQLVTRMR